MTSLVWRLKYRCRLAKCVLQSFSTRPLGLCMDYVCWMPCHFSLFSNTCNVSHHLSFMVFWYTCRQIFWNKISNIHHKWSLLNIISNGFISLIIFHAEFSKILSHVNITVTFESDIVSAEHYHEGCKIDGQTPGIVTKCQGISCLLVGW